MLLPDDAATADACLLQGCTVLEQAPASALGKALSALVDRIDPQVAALRRATSPRRSLLWRSKGRGGRRDRRSSAVQAATGRSRSRSNVRSAGARRRRRGGDGGRVIGERPPAPQAPSGLIQAPPQSPPGLPPSIQPTIQPASQPASQPQGPVPGSPHGPGPGPEPSAGTPPESAPPGTGRHRY